MDLVVSDLVCVLMCVMVVIAVVGAIVVVVSGCEDGHSRTPMSLSLLRHTLHLRAFVGQFTQGHAPKLDLNPVWDGGADVCGGNTPQRRLVCTLSCGV